MHRRRVSSGLNWKPHFIVAGGLGLAVEESESVLSLEEDEGSS
jgi:hypothetical protein